MNSVKRPKDDWAIVPQSTALVVVDMQYAFLEKGAPMACDGAIELVPKINELTALCHRLKIPVIFLKACRRADLSDSGLMTDMKPPAEAGHEFDTLEGKKGVEFYPGLNVTQDDYIVPKIRFSALIHGSSNLELLLRGLGRNSFIICGVTTDVCVATTTTDGMMLGFKVFLVGDLTIAKTKERRQVVLELLNERFAKVMTFDEVMKELGQLAGKT